MDPVDRWLSGEAFRPKVLSNRERLAVWVRQRPFSSAAIVVTFLCAVTLTIGSITAYVKTAVTLEMTSEERDAADRDRIALRAIIDKKTEELKKQDAIWQEKLREQRALETALSEARANYGKSQQQCRAADERLAVELRKVRLSMADDFSAQARALKDGFPEVSLALAAKSLMITQHEGVAPIPAALQQVYDQFAPSGVVRLSGHEGPVALLAASRDGNWIASGDHQGLVRLWHTKVGDPAEAPIHLPGHWGRITHLVFTSDNQWLVSGAVNSTVHLWKLATTADPEAPLLLKADKGRFVTLALSDDGRWLAIATAGHLTPDVFVRLWDLQAKDVLSSFFDLPSYQGQVCSLAISRGGDRVATGNEDGIVRLWQVNNKSRSVVATTLRMQGDPVRALRFSSDGQTVVSAAGRHNGKGTIRTWGISNGNSANDTILANNSNGVEMLANTADGRWLFTADEDPLLRVCDLNTLDQDRTSRALKSQTSPVQAMAVSTNDHWLATAGTDNTVRLWYIGPEGPSAEPVTIRTTIGLVTSIAFANNGDWLVTGNDTGIIQVWNLRVDELVRVANAKVSR